MFNTIGEAAKILFGTMDHDDAMYYDDKIKEVSYNPVSYTHLDVYKRQAYNIVVKFACH